MKKGTKKDDAKTKVAIRLVGYQGRYIDILCKHLFDNNLSLAISKCIDVCMQYDKDKGFIGKETVVTDAWFESPKRHKKADRILEDKRKEYMYNASTFLDKDQLAYVEKFCDKEQYPMFRGSKTNALYAIILTTVMLILNGTVEWYKPNIDSVEVK